MANTYNKVLLLGNLVYDPELKMTMNGTPICETRIAVKRKYAKEGQQEVDFINFTAMRHHADYLCRYFRKGDRLMISGELHIDDYRDRDENQKYVTRIVVDEIVPLKDYSGARANADSTTYDAPAFAKSNVPQFNQSGGDDLPF